MSAPAAVRPSAVARAGALAVGQQPHALRGAPDEEHEREQHEHDETGQDRRRPPAEIQHGQRDQRKDDDSADGLAGLDDGHREPALAAKPMGDDRQGGLVEPGLKAEAQGPDENEEEEEVAMGEGQQDESEPREQRPHDEHQPDVESVDEIADEGRSERGLEPRERERQRGRGAAEIELGEDRQEIDGEPGVVQPALHRVLHAADRHDPPAVEDASRALREGSPHGRPLAASAASPRLTACS